jgi:hypothetical protein
MPQRDPYVGNLVSRFAVLGVVGSTVGEVPDRKVVDCESSAIDCGTFKPFGNELFVPVSRFGSPVLTKPVLTKVVVRPGDSDSGLPGGLVQEVRRPLSDRSGHCATPL